MAALVSVVPANDMNGDGAVEEKSHYSERREGCGAETVIKITVLPGYPKGVVGFSNTNRDTTWRSLSFLI